MSTAGEQSISMEAFKQMADHAGLGLSQQELEELKPIYDLYMQSVAQLHTIDFQAEEIALSFHPDWPS